MTGVFLGCKILYNCGVKSLTVGWIEGEVVKRNVDRAIYNKVGSPESAHVTWVLLEEKKA